MRIMEARRDGTCHLCLENFTAGTAVCPYLGGWVHELCVWKDVRGRTVHTAGYTYFLLLDDDCVKIGWSSRLETLKDRVRKAHRTIAPVASVLAVQDGGESLEHKYHDRFWDLRDGRTETFLGHPMVMSAAMAIGWHEYLDPLNDYLEANRHNW